VRDDFELADVLDNAAELNAGNLTSPNLAPAKLALTNVTPTKCDSATSDAAKNTRIHTKGPGDGIRGVGPKRADAWNA
jgi:hypothetical protein